MASKKIFLRRKDVDSFLPQELRAEAVMKLSSVFVNRQPLKGFDYEDEKKYLNGILDVDPANHEWPKFAKTFWADMTIPVGFEGVELEIGKDESGNPIQIMDFIKYNFALRHPHTALSKEEMDKDYKKRFYIQDTSKDDLKKNIQVQFKKDADKEFIKLSREQIENMLYDVKEKQPKKFLKIATDKQLSMKAEIEEMVSAGILRKIGNQIVFIDEILGDTLENAILHLKDKKNSSKLTILRAKLKELVA